MVERAPATLAEMAKGRLRAKIPQLREALQIARFSDASAFMIGRLRGQDRAGDAPFRASQGTADDHPWDL
ncbi:hypothetical protein [Lentzea atacamensis]|uniref:hypothetical protein n=1 Tax=Lentzea atacamensis TaxID=531938 RepID=UPI000D6D2844|nr:hypothetical protein [Lentzea atacamensis]